MKCAVVMAARDAGKWVLDAVESINNQIQAGWDHELVIGVDGCSKTADVLLGAGVRFWMSDSHCGPYIIRNSLMQAVAADAYAIFDADDVMLPHYLATLLPLVGDGLVGGSREDIDERGRRLGKTWRFVSGVCVISRAAVTALGGYKPWLVAADVDLVLRATRGRIPVVECREVVYQRRRHAGALTQSRECGLASKLREDMYNEAKNDRSVFVSPVTVPMYAIG